MFEKIFLGVANALQIVTWSGEGSGVQRVLWCLDVSAVRISGLLIWNICEQVLFHHTNAHPKSLLARDDEDDTRILKKKCEIAKKDDRLRQRQPIESAECFVDLP